MVSCGVTFTCVEMTAQDRAIWGGLVCSMLTSNPPSLRAKHTRTWETKRQTDWLTHRQRDGLTDTQTKRWTDWLTHRQRDGLTDTQTKRRTDWLTQFHFYEHRNVSRIGRSLVCEDIHRWRTFLVRATSTTGGWILTLRSNSCARRRFMSQNQGFF